MVSTVSGDSVTLVTVVGLCVSQCGLFVSQRLRWPLGKGLGGTSLLNFMAYVRGSRHDFDSWAAGGATGWAYRDVLPYFIRAEGNVNERLANNGQWQCRAWPMYAGV